MASPEGSNIIHVDPRSLTRRILGGFSSSHQTEPQPQNIPSKIRILNPYLDSSQPNAPIPLYPDSTPEPA